LTLIILFISCIQDGNFEVPDLTITEPQITVNSSILKVKTALQQEFNSNNTVIYTFPTDENNTTYIEAFVVSSDAPGNFYKELIIQDSAINPSAGIEVILNNSSLSESYDFGRKIYIKLDGLSVFYDDGGSTIDPTNSVPGKYILGFLDAGAVVNIPSTAIKNHVFRSATVSEIIPQKIELSEITESHLNTFVQFENFQFEKSEIGKSFSGEANDEFSGFRYLFECNSEKTIRLQTSTFASFKSNLISSNKGFLNVILSKDFRAEFLVAIINAPSDISFTEAERCDPVFLDCGNGSSNNNTILFNENFSNLKNNTALLSAGWSNINANGGNTLFSSRTSAGNRFIDISAYNTGENPLEVWLISPAIDLDTSTDEVLSFETNTGYDNGKALTVYISSDFTGNVATANWIQIDAPISEGPASGYGSSFTKSGEINISCLSGNVHIAFKYSGSDGGVTTTFRIDNVKVTSK